MADTAVVAPVVVMKTSIWSRIGQSIRSGWNKTKAFGKRAWAWLTRNTARAGTAVVQGAKVAWSAVRAGGLWLGRNALRTLGGAGYMATKVASWIVDGVASWIALLGTGVFVIAIGAILALGWIGYHWDHKVVGTFRWLSMKDRPAYRDYLNVRSATVAEARSEENGDMIVPRYAKNYKVVGEPTFEDLQALVKMLNEKHDFGIEVEKMDDGTIVFLNGSANGTVYDMNVSEFLSEDKQMDEWILNLLEQMARHTTAKRQKAYLFGRYEALNTARESGFRFVNPDQIWGLIHNKYKAQQDEIPHSPLRKGFFDMFEEIKDAHRLVGV